MENYVCPQCKNKIDLKVSRLIQDNCGHWKCRMCLLKHNICSACVNTVSVIQEIPSRKCNSNISNQKLPKHIVVIAGKPVVYKCTICRKAFKSKSNCCYHKHCADSTEKPFTCMLCNRKFSSKAHFNYHNLMHTGINPFKCTQCDMSFKTRYKLLRHQEIHFEKRKNYYCDVCDRSFLRKTSVKVHKRSHTGEKPYQCSHCSKAFSEKKNLINHLSSHTGKKDWVCEICGKSYPIKWNLELHKRTHTRLRPFCCTVSKCRQTFSQNRYLKRHMETHKNSVKYICSFCKKVFSRKDNLQRHIVNTHLEYQNLNTSKTEIACKLQKEISPVIRHISSACFSKDNKKENFNNFVSCNLNDLHIMRTESVIKSVTKTQQIVNFCTNEIGKLSNNVSVIKKVEKSFSSDCFDITNKRRETKHTQFNNANESNLNSQYEIYQYENEFLNSDSKHHFVICEADNENSASSKSIHQSSRLQFTINDVDDLKQYESSVIRQNNELTNSFKRQCSYSSEANYCSNENSFQELDRSVTHYITNLTKNIGTSRNNSNEVCASKLPEQMILKSPHCILPKKIFTAACTGTLSCNDKYIYNFEPVNNFTICDIEGKLNKSSSVLSLNDGSDFLRVDFYNSTAVSQTELKKINDNCKLLDLSMKN